MLNGFYNTDKTWIVEKNKEIFGIDVCPTCHGQLVEAYNRLNTYYRNKELMAKKKEIKTEDSVYKLKPEFVGATYTNGKMSIRLEDVPVDEVEIYFTAKEIAEYFEK